MAEDGARTGSQQRRPERRLSGGLTGKGGVYAPMKPLPAAVAHPAAHRTRVDAHLITLTPGDGGRLDLEALRERFG